MDSLSGEVQLGESDGRLTGIEAGWEYMAVAHSSPQPFGKVAVHRPGYEDGKVEQYHTGYLE